MDEQRESIWQRVDPSVLSRQPTPEASAVTDEEKRRRAKRTRRKMLLLDLAGTVVWVYAFLKLFVFDVDRAIVERIAPDALEVLNYRFFVLLAILAVVVLLAKRYWLGLLYVLFFPLIVLLWKVPRLIYKTRSWLVLLAVINVVASFVKEFRFNFVTKALAALCILAVLISDRPVVAVCASLALVILLLISYYRNIRATFSPSGFIDLQVTAIEQLSEAEPVTTSIYIAEDLKRPGITKFDEAQLRRFATNLSNGLLAVRCVYFWAYQLDRYRQSPANSFFSFLSYAWLFVITAVTVWMVNLSLLTLDPSLFQYSDYPSDLMVLHYSLSSLVFGGIQAMEPVGDAAILAKLVAGVVGLLLLATFLANLLMSSRRRQQEVALGKAVENLKQRARLLEARMSEEYEVTTDEALQWLQTMGAGFVRLIAFVSSRIPEGFTGPSEGA